MVQVMKRDGRAVFFDSEKIIHAIEKAMAETTSGIDQNLSREIAKTIELEIDKSLTSIHVEDIQDIVENLLMDSNRKDVAKRYIIYRNKRSQSRNKVKKVREQLLSDDFISRYKHRPSPMKQLGDFVYYRTYSRWVDEENRREYWWETVRRAVEYNCSLIPTRKKEAERLFDNVYNLKQFLSGRTFWVGETAVAKHYPMSNYNCSFIVLDSFDAFKELFYLLMIGSGVGARVLKEDVSKLPKVRMDYDLIHKDYTPVTKNEREDNTSLQFLHNNTVKITVGDSKEGWIQSLDFFFKLIYSNEYRNIKTIIVSYDHVRPKGERLKTFGGTASGHSSLKNMFYKINKVIQNLKKVNGTKRVKLQSIDCLDIANIIGENVVVGGVRRTAEMMLVDPTDQDCIEAKSHLYKQIDGQWIVDQNIIHRQMSNNSIYYTEKPTRERLHWQIEKMRYSGEPGWVNAEAAAKRRPNMNGVNPCGEILLDSQGLCNLTTINVYSFVSKEGKMDVDGVLKAQRLSVRAGYRMTCVELELPAWDAVQQRDKLVGCSLTGWQDMVNATGMNPEEQDSLLRQLREVAHEEVEGYAKEIGQNVPLLVTTVKPEGTLSQLPAVSSGVHYSHSPYYIRRIRISADDPLVKVCEELEYPVFPEIGQEWETCHTKVVEFPVKSPEGKTKDDISAIEQLENYKRFMEHYVDHNCSITIHVRGHEWTAVEEWVWENWDDVVALSFLSLDDNFYQLLPYESIDQAEYEQRVKEMKPFVPSLISKYETKQVEYDIGNDGCDAGICPIR
ncbi:ribonucleoside-triphosphate reductase, adenosylcobalamin-dependent [Alkaliphilus metalliredigens QYMF]|uniref:Adenosylcobalamin-dependent ribonucleoside-triphosphate reductase n=1 Tax=Alkaliphilus metalliredigens (strain QYMF) TaxID=293826 RepID=A6TWM4_ALKMQ|nr:ribonucleoside-triphosphate reductase, adenosylcobalamin-dependent [Alkaliphilus metalliredigens]ABR50592.1 ribonucleoside-triphosphate reductase, adenosylcobalamin-dependent [Alkaliphilus metalliredigens QYMF]